MSDKEKLVISYSNLTTVNAQVQNLQQMVDRSELQTKEKMLQLLAEAQESLSKINDYYRKQLKAI